MKKVISLVLTVLMLVSFGTAFAATPVAANELAYKGELEIMHFSTSEEAEGNGGSDGFRTTLAAWSAAHPDITLTQNVLANAEYKTQVATLAAANDLIRVYSMLDIKLNRGLLDNIMLLGLHHAVEPLEAGAERENWEIP